MIFEKVIVLEGTHWEDAEQHDPTLGIEVFDLKTELLKMKRSTLFFSTLLKC